MFARALLILATAAVSTPSAPAQDTHKNSSNISVVSDQPLPNVPGKTTRGFLVEYGPGGSSPAHINPSSAFIYAMVLQGSIRSELDDGPKKISRAGGSFSKFPGDRHGVSAKASTGERARLLGVSVVDADENNLVTNIRP